MKITLIIIGMFAYSINAFAQEKKEKAFTLSTEEISKVVRLQSKAIVTTDSLNIVPTTINNTDSLISSGNEINYFVASELGVNSPDCSQNKKGDNGSSKKTICLNSSGLKVSETKHSGNGYKYRDYAVEYTTEVSDDLSVSLNGGIRAEKAKLTDRTSMKTEGGFVKLSATYVLGANKATGRNSKIDSDTARMLSIQNRIENRGSSNASQ